MIWTCPIKLTFQQIYHGVLSEDAVYDLLDEHFQMGSRTLGDRNEDDQRVVGVSI